MYIHHPLAELTAVAAESSDFSIYYKKVFASLRIPFCVYIAFCNYSDCAATVVHSATIFVSINIISIRKDDEG